MSNIQTLSVKIQQLDSSQSLWLNISYWLCASAAVITLLYVIATWVVNKKSNDLKNAQTELIRAKDQQLAKDLKDKDLQIATTQQETKRIETEAQSKIATLNKEAENAKAGIATAHASAAKANEQTERLKTEAIEASLKLEKEKTKRLELEQAVSPRIMEQYKSSEALKAFTGITAIITNIPDIESQRMAGQLAATLNMAGWKIQFSPYNPKDIYPDGVIIETNVGAIPKEDISSKAADLLLIQLQNNKIDSRTMPARGLPADTLVVKVGFKPYTFFSDKINPDENIRIHGNMIMPPR